MQQIDVNGAPETDTNWHDVVVSIPAGNRVIVLKGSYPVPVSIPRRRAAR